MPRVYIGNLDSRVTEMELEDEFRAFGLIRDLWVARKPPGFAFIDFGDCRGVLDAVRELDGKNDWRVELSHESEGGDGSRARGRGGGGGHGRSGGGGGRGWSGGGGFDLNCYRCGECGHYACKCRNRGGSRRSRSRTPPRYRRSPSSGRSPRGRSPRRRSISPRRRGYSRTPPYRGREDVKHANGNGLRDRWRSRS